MATEGWKPWGRSRHLAWPSRLYLHKNVKNRDFPDFPETTQLMPKSAVARAVTRNFQSVRFLYRVVLAVHSAGVESNSQNSPSKGRLCLETNKWPQDEQKSGPETKNDYAGEGQQQIVALLCSDVWAQLRGGSPSSCVCSVQFRAVNRAEEWVFESVFCYSEYFVSEPAS